MKTPIYHNPTLAPGAYLEIYEYGQFLCLLSISGATTIMLGLDNEPPQVMYSRKSLDCGDVRYSKIVLYNPAALPVTLELTVGDTRTIDSGADTFAAILAVLSTIALRLGGAATMTQPTIITLAATGGAATLIFAANLNRQKISIQAALTNTGTVYLGNAAAHCSDADCFAMLAPGQPCPEDKYQGAVYGVGNDAAQQVVVYEE
jgi:hypothetical protein